MRRSGARTAAAGGLGGSPGGRLRKQSEVTGLAGPDPTQLHAAAQRLRSLASGLDQPVAALPGKYQQGSTWQGPASDHFYGQLASARSQIDRCVAELESYAAALDRKADQPAR